MLLDESRLNESLLKLRKKDNSRAFERASREFDKAFDNLKKKHKEGKLIPSDITHVVHALYRIPPDHIADETYPMFKVVRFAIFAGVPFLVHPALGLIGWLVDRVIEEKVNEKYEHTVLKKYRTELGHVERELERDDLTEDERSNLKVTRKAYEDGVSKLERYYESLKTYRERPDHESDTGHSADDDFDFSESAPHTNGGNAMIYNDEQLLEQMKMQFNEDLDAALMMCLEHGTWELSESTARHQVRTAYSKVERGRRKFDRKVDSVADTVSDGGKKEEIKKMRQEILDGKIKFSTVLRRSFMAGLAALAFGPHIALLGTIAWLGRKSWIKGRQRDELLAELKQEKEILDEKIKDAESDNDKKKKYEYMRLRRQVQRNIDRVRYHDGLKTTDY
jgi:hypothetical protein